MVRFTNTRRILHVRTQKKKEHHLSRGISKTRFTRDCLCKKKKKKKKKKERRKKNTSNHPVRRSSSIREISFRINSYNDRDLRERRILVCSPVRSFVRSFVRGTIGEDPAPVSSSPISVFFLTGQPVMLEGDDLLLAGDRLFRANQFSQ